MRKRIACALLMTSLLIPGCRVGPPPAPPVQPGAPVLLNLEPKECPTSSDGAEALVALQTAAAQHQSSPGGETLSRLAEALEAYLKTPASCQFGPDGNAMGVMAVYGAGPYPRVIRLHALGHAWIQWWADGEPHVQRLYEGALYQVGFSSAFQTTRGDWYLTLLQTEGERPTSEMVVLYRLDQSLGQWGQVTDAFGPFPATVGSLKITSSPDRITAHDVGRIQLEGPGRIKVCEPVFQGACLSAAWDGTHFTVERP